MTGEAVESVDVSDLPGLESLDVPDSTKVTGLDGTELEGLERVFDTEAVLAGVLTNFVEVALDKLLLLDEPDVRKGFSSKFNCLYTVVRTVSQK